MNKKELNEILEKHKMWLESEEGGQRANLQRADLQRADLQRADLRGADIDYSCWLLWCGSKGIKVDRRIAAQLAAHFCALDCDDPEYQAARATVLEFSRTSHRARELGLLVEDAWPY